MAGRAVGALAGPSLTKRSPQDTPEDVHDWLHYHRRLGASQFYIAAVGNDSDHVRYVLQETIRDGSVEQVLSPTSTVHICMLHLATT